MNGKWSLAGRGRSKPQRIATGRIGLWRTRPLGGSPANGRGCNAQSAGKGHWRCVCSLPSPLGLFCILPYFPPFVYYLVSRERLYEASIRRVIELLPTQLMSGLGFCNSTTCKTNAGHNRSGSESGAVQCGARNGGGLASSCVTVIE
jgi:hypothetical protein